VPRAKFVLVTVEVKNVGRVSVDPFCDANDYSGDTWVRVRF
jgi:hypothetical protein